MSVSLTRKDTEMQPAKIKEHLVILSEAAEGAREAFVLKEDDPMKAKLEGQSIMTISLIQVALTQEVRRFYPQAKGRRFSMDININRSLANHSPREVAVLGDFIEGIINNLICDCVENAPGRIMELLPVLTLLLGEREESRFGKIQWEGTE